MNEVQIEVHDPKAEALKLALEEEATEILAKMDHGLLSTRERWDHSKNNWASQIHHPCLKHLVHWRLDWKEAQLIDINGLYRVEEGSELERRIKIEFSNIGYEVNLGQKYFNMEEDIRISGKIDGTVPIKRALPDEYKNIRELPMEVKSVNPVFWDSVRSILDIRRHPKFWISKFPSQLNTYLHPKMMNLPAGFLVLVTFGKRPRILPMLYDQELADHDISRAKRVNLFVKEREYPNPIPYDPSVCDLCPFNHMCDPPKDYNFVELGQEEKDELEDYLLLEKYSKDFEKLKTSLIGNKKKPGKYYGQNGIVEDIQISSKTQIRKQFKIPKEVKDQYRGEDNEITITKIERVGKEF